MAQNSGQKKLIEKLLKAAETINKANTKGSANIVLTNKEISEHLDKVAKEFEKAELERKIKERKSKIEKLLD